MDKVKKAYQILSQLSVSGDAIDIMAVVRSLLRDAIKEAEDGRQDNRKSPESIEP